MTSYFGIIPSDELKSDIDLAKSKRGSSEPQYPLRDKISLKLNDELIDNLLVKLVQQFPASEKRDTAEKLAGYVRSTVSVLLKQLLGKAPNEQVMKSLEFLESSTFVDNTGNSRIGAALPDDLVNQLKASFAAVHAGQGKEQRQALTTQFKLFADQIIKHFMTDYNKTLDLGLIKRKAAELATSAVGKAVHIAIDKLIPALSQAELEAVATHFDHLLVQK
ncbi:hypothetical protein BKE30_08750 [Alkanindiges hydrocarboniclasticus]|jgi:hypothetical protein|uniref:EsvE2 n=1 Tax=Alkanindiges hydrocarboniclasticus TaxID=1907941 RepID=A0A1S8CU95_9GAMM|nr:hypothetical protein [Alkanindiges hydrocarboniclasticus]ONG39848.1 hypothetical protein BKE30_08750 [Alkanindiges hydrocarboniclasticus]